jgi:hypothetical protein
MIASGPANDPKVGKPQPSFMKLPPFAGSVDAAKAVLP